MKKILFILVGLSLFFASFSQTTIPINKGFKLNAGQYIDARWGGFTGIRSRPYASISEANAAVPQAFRSVGDFRFIDDGSGLKIYWYLNSTANGNLIPLSLLPPQTGNGGKFLKTDGTSAYWDTTTGGGSYYTASNGLTLSGSAFKLGGNLTANSTISNNGFSLGIGQNAFAPSYNQLAQYSENNANVGFQNGDLNQMVSRSNLSNQNGYGYNYGEILYDVNGFRMSYHYPFDNTGTHPQDIDSNTVYFTGGTGAASLMAHNFTVSGRRITFNSFLNLKALIADSIATIPDYQKESGMGIYNSDKRSWQYWGGSRWEDMNNVIFVDNYEGSDYEKIQIALNNSKDGDIIQLGNNTYTIDHGLQVTKNITIQGADSSVIKRANETVYALASTANAADSVVHLVSASGIMEGDPIIVSTASGWGTTSNPGYVDTVIGNDVYLTAALGNSNGGATSFASGSLVLKSVQYFSFQGVSHLSTKGVLIKNIIFDGNKANNTTNLVYNHNMGILNSGRRKVTIDGCFFKNSPSETLLGSNMVITNNIFKNLNGSIFHSSTDISEIEPDEFQTTITGNVADSTNLISTSITGHSEGAFTSSNSGGYMSISNNIVTNIVNDAVIGSLYPSTTVHDNGTNNLIFSGNVVSNASRVVYLIDTTTAGTFQNVYIKNNYWNNVGKVNIDRELVLRPNMIIDQYSNGVDSVKKSNDSVYQRINSVWELAFVLSSSGGTVTSFGKIDGYGITSSVANSTTTPVHTVGVDSSVVATKPYVTNAIAVKEPTITASNTAGKYWNGFKSFVSLNSDSATEGSTNLFYTTARAALKVNVSDSSGTGSGKYATQYQLGQKEATITAGTTGQYWRGDKTWQTFPTQDTTTALTGLTTLYQNGLKLNLNGGGQLTGTSAYIGFPSQTTRPTTPSTGMKIFNDSLGRLAWIGTNSFVRSFDGRFITADRAYQLPNISGRVTISDSLITGGRIPYTTTGGQLTSYSGLYFDAATAKFSTGGGSTLNSANGDILMGLSAVHGSTGGGNSGNRFVLCNGGGWADMRINSSFGMLFSTGTGSNVATGTTTGMMAITSGGVAINNGSSGPNAAAILDVPSTTKGVRFPVMTRTQADAISSKPIGLEVYSTTDSCKLLWNGTKWMYAGKSGTYIPTLTNTSNISSSTAYACQYSVNGDVVTVSGQVDITTSSAGVSTELRMTLPLTSGNFTALNQLAGVAAAGTGEPDRYIMFSNNGGTTARVTMNNPLTTGATSLFFTFTYRIL